MTTINEKLLRTLLAETANELRAGKYPPLSREQILEFDGCFYGPFGLMKDHFNMNFWSIKENCGSVHCIGGILSLKGYSVVASLHGPGLEELFFMTSRPWDAELDEIMENITPEQAAQAIDNYLSSGDPKWKEILA